MTPEICRAELTEESYLTIHITKEEFSLIKKDIPIRIWNSSRDSLYSEFIVSLARGEQEDHVHVERLPNHSNPERYRVNISPDGIIILDYNSGIYQLHSRGDIHSILIDVRK